MIRHSLPATALTVLAAIACIATPLQAQEVPQPRPGPGPQPELQKELFSAPLGKNGKWNVYGFLTQASWHDLQTFAATQKDPTGKTDKKGHLLAISSPAEQQYMRMLTGDVQLLIGLTNAEPYGGKRVAADRREGWVWSNGEPLTLDFWGVDGPIGFNKDGSPGRTCIMVLLRGAWFDTTRGTPDDTTATFRPGVIEWDTGLDGPPEGTTALEPILPANLTGPEPEPGKWTAQYLPLTIPGVFHAGSVAKAWETALQAGGKPQAFSFPRLWFRAANAPAEGPLGIGEDVRQMEEPFKSLAQGPFGVVARTKIRVSPEEAGEWTFAADACSTWALRIPGLKWKRATGRGCIDPMDAGTLSHASESGWTATRGVIDLPAGDHVIEMLWGCRKTDAHVSLLAAKGAHEHEGSTDKWRHIGHTPAGKVSWLGTDDAGWHLQSSTPRPLENGSLAPEISLEEALGLLEEAKDLHEEIGAESVNLATAGAEPLTRFPGARAFPNKAKPGDDRYVTAASAKLIIPEDGVYWIGMQGDDKSLLRIGDQTIRRAVQDKGNVLKIAEDAAYVNGMAAEYANRIMVEVELKKGTCDIQAIHVDDSGSAIFAVFGGPAGMAPRLIRKGSAAAVEDVAGLPFAP